MTSITLSQCVRDIRTLTQIVREGWDKRIIFNTQNNPEELYTEPYDSTFQTNLGWVTILEMLDNLLEQNFLRYREGSSVVPKDVLRLLTEAEGFLALCPKEQPHDIEKLTTEIAHVLSIEEVDKNMIKDVLVVLSSLGLLKRWEDE